MKPGLIVAPWLEFGERRPRLGRLLFSSLLFVLALQSISHGTVTRSLVMALEASFPRAAIGNGSSITGIIVLGGGHDRLREAGRLARTYGHLRLFVSGAGDTGEFRRILGQDIPPSRIETENRSRSTFQNALFTNASVQPRAGERWLLVTSAAHMPRAMGAFRSVGFDIEPWPVHDLSSEGAHLGPVLHEALGLVWYWLLGRSSALFPRP